MIAFDATGEGTGSDIASPLTYSHTFTGSNGLLLIAIGVNTATTFTVTYNGDACTQLLGPITNSSYGVLYIFGLLNPDTGSNTVSISWASGNRFIRSISCSYTGVRQSGLPDATASDNTNSSASSASVNLSTTANPTWGFVATLSADSSQVSGNTNVTERNDTGTNLIFAGDSNGSFTPGSNTMSVSISPASGGGVTIGAVSFADIDQVDTAGSSGYSFFM